MGVETYIVQRIESNQQELERLKRLVSAGKPKRKVASRACGQAQALQMRRSRPRDARCSAAALSRRLDSKRSRFFATEVIVGLCNQLQNCRRIVSRLVAHSVYPSTRDSDGNLSLLSLSHTTKCML